MSTTARRAIRLSVQAVLTSMTNISVVSPGDWETPSINLPEIKLRCVGDRKISVARSGANFTTTVTLEILARVGANTAELAQDAIEALGGRIEDAVLALPELFDQLQQVASVDTETAVTSNGREHIGELRMSLQCETFEVFNPLEIYGERFQALQQMLIHLDTANPFDATGTYAGAPFPDAVKSAPRTAGPDGRDEATLQINLPT